MHQRMHVYFSEYIKIFMNDYYINNIINTLEGKK